MKIKALFILGAFALTPVLSACGGTDEEMATYCVDAAGTVLDEDYCDPDNEHYSPMFIVWESHDSHKYKKGKKIPGGDFRKGTTSKPSSKGDKPKASVGKSDTKKESPKPKANTSSKPASKPAPAKTTKK